MVESLATRDYVVLQLGQAWHLAVAVNSSNAHIRAQALSCVRTLAVTFSPQEEELIARLAKSLDSSLGQQPQQQHNATAAQPSNSQQSAATLSGSHPVSNTRAEVAVPQV